VNSGDRHGIEDYNDSSDLHADGSEPSRAGRERGKMAEVGVLGERATALARRRGHPPCPRSPPPLSACVDPSTLSQSLVLPGPDVM